MPIGGFLNLILDMLTEKIKDIFGVEVKIKPNLETPFYAYDHNRHQYYSSKIIEKMLNYTENDCVKMLGMVDLDLCTPILDFVFGEAQLNGIAAIISLKRLKQEFYGFQTDQKLLMERAAKEAIHELGHTFGLIHCNHPVCVMRLSSNVFKIDLKSDDFCDACFEKLKKHIRNIKLKGEEN